MLSRLYPSEHYKSIFDINYEKLHEAGYRGLLFDVDNTLVPFDVEEASDDIIALFTDLKKRGFKICLVSNNTKQRVHKFNEKLKVFAIPNSLKPSRRNLKKGMHLMETNKENTVLIGDQLFTDVWGGNRLGIKTILVYPIQEKEQFITRIKRDIEKLIFNRYLKRNK